jgi:hypothetical protein
MGRKSGYVVGFGAAVAMVSLIAGLEVEVAVARTTVQPMPVNRILKGDRLPVAPITRTGPAQTRVDEPKLPDGCHAAFSASKNRFSSEVAGRCLG